MECNKDEALRAKEIAEKKMQSKDFLGAQKVALKAERIYPQLENISQLLTVCNVHCSAQSSTIGPEKDWYQILQIDMMADEETIKKQYRKLVLVVHPDKNKFPGAEEAFKLIREAYEVLFDPAKKKLYDSRYKALSKSTAAKLSGQDHQQTQPASAAFSETFRTRCPSCTERYESCRGFDNRPLLCRKCLESSIPYDLGSQGASRGPQHSHPGDQDVPLRSNISQPYQQKEVPNQGTSKMAADKAGFTTAQMASQQGPSTRTRGSQQEVCREKTVQLSEDIKAKGKDRKYDKGMGGVKEWAAMPKVNNKGRKRGRKQTVESSESIDALTCTETEAEDIESASCPPLGEGFGRDGFDRRRSSRLQQHVSYNEGASDDENDLASPPKKVRADQSAGDDMSKQKEAVSDDDSNHANPTGFYFDSEEKATQNGTSPPKENVQNKYANIGKVDKQAAGPSLIDVEIVDVDNSDSEPNTDPPVLCISSASELDTYSSDLSDYSDSEPDKDPPEKIDCPDPEFSDFDKHREESCFAADQFWACYGDADFMPRYYCQIKKVLSPKFELRFTWLEAESENSKWLEAGLPVGCGNFVRGTGDRTTERLTFSHLVKFEESTEGILSLHPKKGEIWALFKDWDIGWNDPENRTKYKYEVVEVLSDFVEGVSIEVNYLDKVNGFVSLFQPTSQTNVASFFVKPNELYKFSHLIPFFKMNGTERNDVPVRSFELDPAALPLYPDSIWYPGK